MDNRHEIDMEQFRTDLICTKETMKHRVQNNCNPVELINNLYYYKAGSQYSNLTDSRINNRTSPR